MTTKEHSLLKIIWDYLKLDQEPHEADVILVFGSLQTQPALKAAELYLAGFAPLIIFSGGFGIITKDHNDRPEAEIFAEIAYSQGVPKSAVLIEPRATNTSDNILFSKQLLESHDIHPKSVLLIHKKYDERRTFATFQKQWPGIEATITSPNLTFDEWLATPLKARNHTDVLMGIMHRIMVYPSKGYMIEQSIPDEVKGAFDQLVAIGHKGGLIPA